MTERDPFQKIVDAIKSDGGVENKETDAIHETATSDLPQHTKALLVSFFLALLQLALWSFLLGVGLLVIFRNLYDAGIISVTMPFWEAYGIGLGTLAVGIAARQGTR